MADETDPTQPDAFWTDDQLLAEDTMVERRSYLVRARIHTSEETYPARYGQSEIVPIADSPGVRDYVLIHPYVLVPDIHLTIGLYPTPSPAGAIGKVTGSRWDGMRHLQIGSGQAWYYRTDKTIVLWELELYPHFETSSNPREDLTLIALWQGFERYLSARFPEAEHIATPSWEPGVEQEVWQAFLSARGYTAATPRAFIKGMKRI